MIGRNYEFASLQFEFVINISAVSEIPSSKNKISFEWNESSIDLPHETSYFLLRQKLWLNWLLAALHKPVCK